MPQCGLIVVKHRRISLGDTVLHGMEIVRARLPHSIEHEDRSQ